MTVAGSLPDRPLRLGVLQFAPVLGDVVANARRIADAADQLAGDLLLTPELSLTGYDLRDAVGDVARPLEPAPPPLGEAPGDVLVGLVEATDAGGRNAAVVYRGGRVQHVHRKIYLPTYGMFDEARHFRPGREVRVWERDDGWRVGVLVCEDFWHPGLHYVLASAGIHLLLVQSAAPGRGVWEGGEGGTRFANMDGWVRIARTTAALYGIWVALANRTGVEGPITFGGGSLLAGPDGELLHRAGPEGDDLLVSALDPADLRRARTPYAHARDDDPALVARELARILDARQ